MIVTRTPLRLSFVGGGTDISQFYRIYGGAVVSTTINKYVYICFNGKFDDRVRVSYSITEETDNSHEIKHPLVNAILRKLQIDKGVEIVSIADVPSFGSGLGSSSSFTVGLLKAAYKYINRDIRVDQLAEDACEVEIEMCGEPIGKQDQYTAAYGGLNYIRFASDDSVDLHPIKLQHDITEKLNNNMMLYFTNKTRSASELLTLQRENIKKDKNKVNTLKTMAQLAEDLKLELESNNINSFGEILHENWILKKSLSEEISNEEIDAWYEKAREAGAIGGKILGAGGGGFLLFYVEPDKQESVADALKDLKRIDIKFEQEGSVVILDV